MKKNFKYYIITWLISVAVFNIISFIAPIIRVGLFWVGYAMITVMFIIQLACSLMFFKQNNKEKIFLNIPIITISYAALIVSVIVGLVFMAMTGVSFWLAIIIASLVTGFYLIAIISVKTATDSIENTNEKVNLQTLFVKSLNVEAQTLAQKAYNDDIRLITDRVCEAVRYSDPVSNESLADCESKITLKFKEFEKSVVEHNTELAEKISNELISLINERNQKCKLMK